MVETDWKEILSFSQRELTLADKDKLCESLCWMESDDIELNFSDLKTLFRLAQDILKLKIEQINNLIGQIETTQRKSGKVKVKSHYTESPTQSNDSALETITHQEEIIKANKEILEQLYENIAELEGRKSKLEESRSNMDVDSESSRDVLSEMNAVVELEHEIAMKNKHIRKLLADVKILEEENTKLKEKVSVLKDKLTEGTQLIDNLREQLLSINNEHSRMKEVLGKSEQAKVQLSMEIEQLRKEVSQKECNEDNIYEEIKAKVQHWKNIARSKKAEVEKLLTENKKLKENTLDTSKPTSPQVTNVEKNKIKELQDKLVEASDKIEKSANIITLLRSENKQLKAIVEESQENSISEPKNESDDGKERIIINKLKRKVKSLTISLQGSEEMIAAREKELTEISSQLQLLQSDEGVSSLLEGLKNKKRQLKLKDEEIKKFVNEVNNLSQLVDDLQLENETMRKKFNVPSDEKIQTTGILQHYQELQKMNSVMDKELKRLDSNGISLELNNRELNTKLAKMENLLKKLGYAKEINYDLEQFNETHTDEGASLRTDNEIIQAPHNVYPVKEMEAVIEENKGLREGLQEILIFLKDNSETSSGVLTLESPSLEAILLSMEARNSAGWFSPHMKTVFELRAALGGKDALLSALHEARKETFNVMEQLSKEVQKSSQLEQKLLEMEIKNKEEEAKEKQMEYKNENINVFGSWMSEKEIKDINFYDKSTIDDYIHKGNALYELQLKKGLEYFQFKFKTLFDKMTSMTIQATDDLNKWSIQEEQYKAEIEYLRGQLQQVEEDNSDHSPGLLDVPSLNVIQRKCNYLEESYKYLRTLNENLKNEILDNRKESMIEASEYETKIQTLLVSITNLTDKLRTSIPIEIFWKQNAALNNVNLKYRNLLECEFKTRDKFNLLQQLEHDKHDIINYVTEKIIVSGKINENFLPNIMSNADQIILRKQFQQVCDELNNETKTIEILEQKNLELQEGQAKIIDETLSSITREELDLIKNHLQKIAQDNNILKEQCQHVNSQLNIALLQLQDSQQRQLSNDMEINMLRHQILDLQSAGDNKAIIARLSGEILVAHLQASESYKKLEKLNLALIKEKELRADVEEMLQSRQNIFDIYSLRYDSKLRYIYQVMQGLRQQYQGSIPIISVENYLNNLEELLRKNRAVDDKLTEIEDLRSSLINKHSVYEQLLDVNKNKCLEEEDTCSHKLKYLMMQSMSTREQDHINRKIKVLEQSRIELIKHCNNLEKILVLVNQGFEKNNVAKRKIMETKNDNIGVTNLEIEDVLSDDEESSSSKMNQTITLSKPQILKPEKDEPRKNNTTNTASSPIKINYIPEAPKLVTVMIQTIDMEPIRIHNSVQTEEDKLGVELESKLESVKLNYDKVCKELLETKQIVCTQVKEINIMNREKSSYNSNIQNLKDANNRKEHLNETLRSTIDELKNQLNEFKMVQINETSKIKETVNEENKILLASLKQLENDKNTITIEYKQLLSNEREEYSKAVKELHIKIMELQSKLDRRGSESSVTNGEALKEIIAKYTMKIAEFEDKCFKLQSELDDCKSELTTYQTEAERWKDLATERLTKMEQLNSQLGERHCHEVQSYKAENQHWLTQLNDMQREHIELRSRLTEQKTIYVKQLADKDSQIEQLRSVVNNLKIQIINMQTLISVNDPSFDMSAIVEVDECTEVLSQNSDRLELKFDSTVDLHDTHDDVVKFPATSTTIWQEPIIERLRREKQLAGKQNLILRRQIKILASRERRARLDAQNLKNQVFRISTTGNKVATAETAALQNKIASLQAQLTSARRDTHSSIALWDKWKRSQQAADRWQARYEEKCQEVKKLDASLHLAKSAVTRLEKEKHVLLSRLTDAKNENQLIAIEKHDNESQEKSLHSSRDCVSASTVALPVSTQALLDRVQAQQRRIAALEVAERGNEVLVSEYERSLAEITSLKGQVLKLESTLLESQIRTPIKSTNDTQPELDYWKSYCEMLKDENVQLNRKINSLELTPTTAHQHRVNDLEQTVLTLRGLVSKLQADQKSGNVTKKVDPRPSSGRSGTEKGHNQLESYRVEIANLKRSIQDKDLLLERSKEMLKMAAEREDDLLRENAFLRRQLEEITRPKEGFLSA